MLLAVRLILGVYSELAAAPLISTMVGTGNVLLTASCSSYFWKVVPAGTLESPQSNFGVRLVTSTLLIGAVNTGTLGAVSDKVAVGGILILVGVGVAVGGILVFVGIAVAVGGTLVLVGVKVALVRLGVFIFHTADQALYCPRVL